MRKTAAHPCICVLYLEHKSTDTGQGLHCQR